MSRNVAQKQSERGDILMDINTPRNNNEEFERLVSTHEGRLRRHIGLLISRDQNLQPHDEDDIYVQGLTKFWKSYFANAKRGRYDHRSDEQDYALLKQAVTWVSRDISKSRRREKEVLKLIDLDAPIGDDGFTIVADTVSSPDLIEDDVEAQLLISEALAEACQSARSSARREVVEYLLGDLVDIELDTKHFNVVKHRIQKSVLAHLNKS